MARRRRRKMDPDTWALWAEQRRRELPPGIPVDFFHDVCTRLDVVGVWGCQEDSHSQEAARKFISETDFASRPDEVLAWLEGLGGVCDCSIQKAAYRRLVRLCEAWDDGC